ncbi:MAG: hypothetical protein ACTSX3_02075 [Candidatus Thorarchaeota archaeon]
MKGRAGTIVVDEQEVGYFGEVAPEVLVNFEMGRPVVAFELLLPESGSWS